MVIFPVFPTKFQRRPKPKKGVFIWLIVSEDVLYQIKEDIEAWAWDSGHIVLPARKQRLMMDSELDLRCKTPRCDLSSPASFHLLDVPSLPKRHLQLEQCVQAISLRDTSISNHSITNSVFLATYVPAGLQERRCWFKSLSS